MGIELKDVAVACVITVVAKMNLLPWSDCGHHNYAHLLPDQVVQLGMTDLGWRLDCMLRGLYKQLDADGADDLLSLIPEDHLVMRMCRGDAGPK